MKFLEQALPYEAERDDLLENMRDPHNAGWEIIGIWFQDAAYAGPILRIYTEENVERIAFVSGRQLTVIPAGIIHHLHKEYGMRAPMGEDAEDVLQMEAECFGLNASFAQAFRLARGEKFPLQPLPSGMKPPMWAAVLNDAAVPDYLRNAEPLATFFGLPDAEQKLRIEIAQSFNASPSDSVN